MTIKVKPLVWVDHDRYAAFDIGAGFTAYYSIKEREHDLEGVTFGIHCHEFGEQVVWVGPKGGGQAAAQAHHEAAIRSQIEEGGDALGSDRASTDTSPGVTAGAVDPAAIRAEALREIDLSRADRGDHPDIKTDETMYLACIAGVWFFGPFSRQWYGLNFTRWGNTGCQFDAPGTNASRWERVIEVNLDALITKGGDQ